jgi:hypothetical protein
MVAIDDGVARLSRAVLSLRIRVCVQQWRGSGECRSGGGAVD